METIWSLPGESLPQTLATQAPRFDRSVGRGERGQRGNVCTLADPSCRPRIPLVRPHAVNERRCPHKFCGLNVACALVTDSCPVPFRTRSTAPSPPAWRVSRGGKGPDSHQHDSCERLVPVGERCRPIQIVVADAGPPGSAEPRPEPRTSGSAQRSTQPADRMAYPREA